MGDEVQTPVAARAIVVTVAAIGLGVGTLTWIWFGRPLTERGARGQVVPLEGSQLTGRRQAPVGILLFSDFQCPSCIEFALGTLADIRREYLETGKVLLSFRHLPLSGHPFARRGAEAATCAARQDKFWSFHDELFATRGRFDDFEIQAIAKRVHLDTTKFEECLISTTRGARQDSAWANRLGVSATPTFIIGQLEASNTMKVERILEGRHSIEEFRTAIDAVSGLAGR